MDIAKLDRALEAALIFLGREPDEATHRLSDILVEEVSLVDRAANRRRFLVVKQHGGNMDATTDFDIGDDLSTSTKQALVIPTPVKEGLMRIITEATERLVSVGNMVRGADETAEEAATPLPDELAKEIGVIADLLRGALSRYPSPMSMNATKAEGALSQGLRAVGETAMSLATSAAESDELPADLVASVRNLAAQLNALVEKYPQPTAGAAPSGVEAAVVEETAKTDEPVPAATEPAADVEQEKAEMDEKLSSMGSETGDKLAVIAQAIARVAEATNPDELAAIRDQMVGVGKSLAGLNDAEMDEVSKAVGPSKLLRVLAALRPVFAMLEQEGQTPPAATEPTDQVDAEKRAAETQPQPPAREGGDLDNVGTGPTVDKAVKDGPASDPITEIAKRLDAIERTIAGAPEVPASRTENPPPQGKGDGDNRSRSGRRGGPWIM